MIASVFATIAGPCCGEGSGRGDEIRRGSKNEGKGGVAELEPLDDGGKEAVEAIGTMVGRKHDDLFTVSIVMRRFGTAGLTKTQVRRSLTAIIKPAKTP